MASPYGQSTAIVGINRPAWRNATKKVALCSQVIGEDQARYSEDLMHRKFGRLL